MNRAYRIDRNRPAPSASGVRPKDGTVPPDDRFLSETECADIAQRVASLRDGGGESLAQIESWWRGTLRFARNRIRSSGDRRSADVLVTRNIEGAECTVSGNQIDDVNLRALVRRAERLLKFKDEQGDIRFQTHAAKTLPENVVDRELITVQARTQGQAQGNDIVRGFTPDSAQARHLQEWLYAATALPPEPFDHPKLLFESTLAMASPNRAAAVAPLVEQAVKAGMYASGTIEVSALGTAYMGTWGTNLYYPQTRADYSVTVRSPDGTASGWAGISWNDWDRIDGVTLSSIALDKCLRSRNPLRVEPGRYTTILEPQAVYQLFSPILTCMMAIDDPTIDPPRIPSEKPVLDERITVRADPMDPDCGFLPIDLAGQVYHKATWFERGRTLDFPYTRHYGLRRLHKYTGLPLSRSFHMDAGTSTMDDMVATTQRGILITHFYMLNSGNPYMKIPAQGYTRDGTWLIEHGKVTKPIKNLRFLAHHFPVFNNVEQIGPAQRVYSQDAAIVPAMKVRDFNFTALTDAV